jgi:ATP/maltotriose-dependent transcriptional regulator MalT
MLSYIPLELIKVKKLADEGRHDEALHLLREYEKEKAKSILEQLSSNLLESDILFQQGLYEKAFEKAVFVYNRSKIDGENRISIDALIKKINLLFYRGKLEKVYEAINDAENLVTTISFNSEKDYQDIKARIIFHKARFYGSTYDL